MLIRNLKVVITCTLVLASALVWGQNAQEKDIKFNKAHHHGVVAEFNHPPDAVEAAIRKKLAEEGFTKIKSSKGFMTLSGVQWRSVSNDKMDVYIKVDGKKNNSLVQVLLSKGYDNFISSQNDPQAIDHVKTFLNDLAWHTSIYQQENAVSKADKELKLIQDNNNELLAQKEKLEKRIEENNQNATTRQKLLEEEKQKLEALKLKAN